jgi:uncharacterized protein YcnI
MSKHAYRAAFAAGAFFLVCPTNAFAHATLENQQAVVGAGYKAVMRIPHGCGAQATHTVKIRVPDGVIGVKPMPKPGWILETVKGKYDKTYELFHSKISEGVKEITWRGGNLPNDWYDEFVFTGTIAEELKVGETIYFPTVQECEGGAERWIEIPAAGKPANELKFPAPGLKLAPKQ